MILAEIDEGEDTHIKVKGHAEKEVCAAVSGLFYALWGYLEETGCAIKRCKVNEGDAELVFNSANIDAVRMFETGLRNIEKAYENSLHLVKAV